MRDTAESDVAIVKDKSVGEKKKAMIDADARGTIPNASLVYICISFR